MVDKRENMSENNNSNRYYYRSFCQKESVFMKYSKQREAIRTAVSDRIDHPTADVIYEEVKKIYPNISLGTVYRNLVLLESIGEIAKIKVGDGVEHFDPNIKEHYHFVCKECGKVRDIEVKITIGDEIMSYPEGKILGHKAFFYGICNDCINKKP